MSDTTPANAEPDNAEPEQPAGEKPAVDGTEPTAPIRPPGPVSVSRREDEMAWSGIQTFLKFPVCMTPEDLRAGEIDVAICGVPWDGTATGLTGTHLGPRAIRAGDYISGGRYLHHLDVRLNFMDHLKLADYGDADVFIGQPEKTYDSIKGFIAEIIDGGAMPVILGGDHGITWPCGTAVADAYGHGNVGIVHFDAHADTSPDMRGALHGHGTPMRRLIESGAVPGRNFVQVGLRGYYPPPDTIAWMEEQKMRTHFMAEIRRDGFGTVIQRALEEALDQADHLYISLDVDVCDPSYTPGTGTPEPGGLTTAEMLWAVRRLAAEVGIVAMDVVEVSPPYDVGPNITALFAKRAVMEALTGTAMRKVGLTEPDYVDPGAAGPGVPDTNRNV